MKTNTLTKSTKGFYLISQETLWSENKMDLICKKKQKLGREVVLGLTYLGRFRAMWNRKVGVGYQIKQRGDFSCLAVC